MDRKNVLYYRYIENIFELLEKIGGFKESVFKIIFFLAFFWQQRMFKGSFFK